ncbi:two-component sensor histidine kinase [Vibrio sp. HA2012]|uniref:sensor histidine kinase n=1 Tax=Vibrio sp. HA2012 TaxID=1971595 RepID=UPI000C2BB14B|nr:ATP-binding protein [Vibrio sp. HA2012]PJC87263.1 two-component sensor histidine kinase [Vibrio sp. HA2012]
MFSRIALLLTTSISRQILIAYVIGALLSIFLIISVSYALLSFNKNFYAQLDIAEYSHAITKKVEFNEKGKPTSIASDDDYIMSWMLQSLQSELAVRVLDSKGNTVFKSSSLPIWPSDLPFTPNEKNIFHFVNQGIPFDASTHPFVRDGNQWYVQVAVSRRFMQFSHSTFGFRFTEEGITIFSFVLFVVFGLCAHLTLKYALRPLRRVSQSAQLISPRSLQARLDKSGMPTELIPMIDSFNHVLNRLEKGFRLQQEFLATAAHELKTPIALLKTQLDVMPDSEEKYWLMSDVDYMTRQVQQLLMLAEVSEENNYIFTLVNPADIANEVSGYLKRMANAHNISIHVTVTPVLSMWHADKGALFTLLKNLVENAIQHSPSGSQVGILLDKKLIKVSDQGTGVAEQDLDKLFDRFWKGAERKDTGAGLGLSICKEISLAHNWDLIAVNNTVGLTIEIHANPHN